MLRSPAPAILIALLLALAPAAQAATFSVDTNADVPVGSAADCTDADTGTPCSIRDALAAAAGSDEDDRIEVPADHYVLTGGSLHTTGAFAVTIAGAGADAHDARRRRPVTCARARRQHDDRRRDDPRRT